eukprot:TRINITY_DN6319_c0_g2_i1.p1 TRINITY_DN6319_c0_g2~~TRINITY_DN6319_c0_g2_i1.p1  ORF type:complete len:381 (+),score=74.71 TRINITY_DN6319_c0_g2_i1:181-1323(+)
MQDTRAGQGRVGAPVMAARAGVAVVVDGGAYLKATKLQWAALDEHVRAIEERTQAAVVHMTVVGAEGRRLADVMKVNAEAAEGAEAQALVSLMEMEHWQMAHEYYGTMKARIGAARWRFVAVTPPPARGSDADADEDAMREKAFFDAGRRQRAVDTGVCLAAAEYLEGRVRNIQGRGVAPAHVVVAAPLPTGWAPFTLRAISAACNVAWMQFADAGRKWSSPELPPGVDAFTVEGGSALQLAPPQLGGVYDQSIVADLQQTIQGLDATAEHVTDNSKSTADGRTQRTSLRRNAVRAALRATLQPKRGTLVESSRPKVARTTAKSTVTEGVKRRLRPCRSPTRGHAGGNRQRNAKSLGIFRVKQSPKPKRRSAGAPGSAER